MIVLVTKVGGYGVLEVASTAKHAASDLLVGNLRKEAFDEVEPRSGRRREVDVVARVCGEPVADEGCLVGA